MPCFGLLVRIHWCFSTKEGVVRDPWKRMCLSPDSKSAAEKARLHRFPNQCENEGNTVSREGAKRAPGYVQTRRAPAFRNSHSAGLQSVKWQYQSGSQRTEPRAFRWWPSPSRLASRPYVRRRKRINCKVWCSSISFLGP